MISERQQVVAAGRLEAGGPGALQHPFQRLVDQVMRPAVARLLDDVLAGVSHHDDPLDGVAHFGEAPGHGGADGCGPVGRQVVFPRQRPAQLAHQVASLDGDFAGQGGFDARGQSLDAPGQAKLGLQIRQNLLERFQRCGQGNEVVQRRVGIDLLEGHHFGVAVTAVGRDDDLGAGVVNPVGQGFGGKAAEHRGVDQAQAFGRLGVEQLLRDIGQVECHPVAGLEAQLVKHLGAQHGLQQ